MNIWNGIRNYPRNDRKFAASIGNYDGVHLGHREILRRVVEQARARDCGSLLITFDPHPQAVLAPERDLRLIQTRDQKLRSLEATGLTDLLIVEFTPEIARLSGMEFFERCLAPMPMVSIHVGENFRFGRGREGDIELLAQIGRERGFEVHPISQIRQGDKKIASSEIRRRLSAGDVEGAASMLGRPYSMTGRIVHGEGRGRTMEFPTANLQPHGDSFLPSGVYITEVLWNGVRYPSVTNIGLRPTFDGKGRRIETHLLEFDQDLYSEELELLFCARLRDEQKFDSADDLADQIARDRAAADAYFRNVSIQHG